MGKQAARDQYVIARWLAETGCVAVGGRYRGVSGVRVNPVNPVLENWGKGRRGEPAESWDTRTRLAIAVPVECGMRRREYTLKYESQRLCSKQILNKEAKPYSTYFTQNMAIICF